MKIKELITEKSTDYRERSNAYDALLALFRQFWPKEGKTKDWKPPNGNPIAYAKQAKQLVTIAGRGQTSWETARTAGWLHDRIIAALQEMHVASGQSMPFPTGAGQTATAFQASLALFFRNLSARGRNFSSRRWTMGAGGSHQDPSQGLEFNTAEEQNEAWEHIEANGKKIYLKNPYNRTAPKEYIKIGKFLLSKGSQTYGAFSDTPRSEYFIYIQTTGLAKNPITAAVDMTDQQAASLRDIANTKNANAMNMLKAMVGMFKGEEEMKKGIANSKKITPNDKMKLDKIIAGAANFREPDEQT